MDAYWTRLAFKDPRNKSTVRALASASVHRSACVRPRLVLLVIALLTSGVAGAQSPMRPAHHGSSDQAEVAPEISFEQTMHQAMQRMDDGMAIRHSGDPDRDFAAMMIPHHQGAIDMARAELLFGRDPVLRRLAQGIIVEQEQEIQLMHRELQRIAPSYEEREK